MQKKIWFCLVWNSDKKVSPSHYWQKKKEKHFSHFCFFLSFTSRNPAFNSPSSYHWLCLNYVENLKKITQNRRKLCRGIFVFKRIQNDREKWIIRLKILHIVSYIFVLMQLDNQEQIHWTYRWRYLFPMSFTLC